MFLHSYQIPSSNAVFVVPYRLRSYGCNDDPAAFTAPGTHIYNIIRIIPRQRMLWKPASYGGVCRLREPPDSGGNPRRTDAQRQRGFAGAGNSGNADNSVQRNIYVYVFQIVDPGSTDKHFIYLFSPRAVCPCFRISNCFFGNL